MRAAFAARLGTPLTGQMLTGTLPYYPSLTVIDGQPTYIHKQMQSLEQSSNSNASVNNNNNSSSSNNNNSNSALSSSRHTIYHPTPITDTQVAHARLHKAGHRPLGSMFTFPLVFCLRSLVAWQF